MIYFGRRVAISMGHRLHQPALSAEANRALYGKCNNPNGHGHRYVIEATVAGRVDPTTGFSASLPLLDAILQREIVERFDHRDFDRDFPEYDDVVSSGECLACLFWDLIAPCLPPETPLARLRVEETQKNAFEYFGEAPLMPGARVLR